MDIAHCMGMQKDQRPCHMLCRPAADPCAQFLDSREFLHDCHATFQVVCTSESRVVSHAMS